MSFMSIFAPGVGFGLCLVPVGFLASVIIKGLEKVANWSMDNEKKATLVLCRITEIAMVPITIGVSALILIALIVLWMKFM